MKKWLLLLLLFVGTPTFAQTSITGRWMVGLSATRPAVCASGDTFIATDLFVAYLCGPANTWVAFGGGGGGFPPAGPNASIQIYNGGALGSATGFALDSPTSPTQFNIPFSESVQGPRPRVDVTAYGAKGDGTDDTAAIQAAINAACAGGPTGYGTVFFPAPPSNSYNVSQPQTPSTAPVFTTCAGLHLQGANGNHSGAQFTYAPGVQISVLSGLGGSPNDAPVFTSNNNMTYENLVIRANNQAFQVGCATCAGLTGVMFKNVTGTILNTGHANNVFYYVSNTLGDHWEDSAAQVGSTQYIWGFDDTVGAQPVGLIFIDGGTYVGCPIKYTNNVIQTSSGPGAWFIRNLWGEVCNSDLISITNPSVLTFPLISDIHLDNVSVADSACNTCALINLNSTGTTLSNVTIANSTVGNGGQGVAIRNTAGTVRDWHVEGANVGESVDVNGFPLASGTGTNSNGGRDFIANTSDLSRMNSFWSVAQAAGPMSRYFAGGNSVSGLAIDPTGVFLNDATNRGYNAGLKQTTRETLDVAFAQTLSPTAVAGSATTGGSLAANTYFAWVSTTSDNCTTISATSLPSSGVVVGGANNAITVSWTLPPTTVTTPAGYCVSLSVSTTNLPAGQIFVAGASTTSSTINSIPGGQTQIAYNTFSAVHRFTSSALGVNTTSPVTNLDVNGGIACAKVSKTALYTIATSDCEVQASVAAGSFSLTLQHALTRQIWFITRTDNSANSLTLQTDSGNLNGVGASLTLSPFSTTIATCDGTNCWTVSGSGGGGGSTRWDALLNPAGNFNPNMAGFTSTFSYSSALANAFAWSNATLATGAVVNQNSPSLEICGNIWNGAASTPDCWTLQVVEGSGTNPTTSLTLGQSGSSGQPVLAAPKIMTMGGSSTTLCTGTGSGICSGSEGTGPTTSAGVDQLWASSANHWWMMQNNGGTGEIVAGIFSSAAGNLASFHGTPDIQDSGITVASVSPLVTAIAAHNWIGNPSTGSAVASANLIGASDTGPNACATDTGAANAYVIAPTQAVTALTKGTLVCFLPANPNTTTSTLNVSTLGVKSFIKVGGAALVSGDITTQIVYALYDGTAWYDLNPQTSGGGGGSINAGTQFNFPYYAANGTTLSPETNFNTDASHNFLLGGKVIGLNGATVSGCNMGSSSGICDVEAANPTSGTVSDDQLWASSVTHWWMINANNGTNGAVVAQGTGAAAHGVLISEGPSALAVSVGPVADSFPLWQSGSADPVATTLTNCSDSAHTQGYSTVTHTFSCIAISAGAGGGGGGFSQSFTSQTSVTITGATHGLGTSNMVVEVYDNASPPNILQPANITVDQSTFNVVVTFNAVQTGKIVLVASPGKYTASFTNQTSLSVTAATHKLGASFFHVSVYDTSGNKVDPGLVNIDGSGNVVVTFALSQSGQVVIE